MKVKGKKREEKKRKNGREKERTFFHSQVGCISRNREIGIRKKETEKKK